MEHPVDVVDVEGDVLRLLEEMLGALDVLLNLLERRMKLWKREHWSARSARHPRRLRLGLIEVLSANRWHHAARVITN